MIMNPIEIETRVSNLSRIKETMVTKLIISLLLLQLSTTAFCDAGSQNAGPILFCVARGGTSDQSLSANIDYACNQASVNCQAIQPGGACFTNNLKTRASFAMNAYYNLYRSLGGTCDFSGSGQVINFDPSASTGNGSCQFSSGSKAAPINTRGSSATPTPIPKTPKPSPRGDNGPGLKWCIAKPHADIQALQKNLDWLCGMIECQAIQPGGACYDESVRSRASFAMNSYYQTKGRNDYNCDFSGTGLITTVDPSHGQCRYLL